MAESPPDQLEHGFAPLEKGSKRIARIGEVLLIGRAQALCQQEHVQPEN
jgi:hypothetical protein